MKKVVPLIGLSMIMILNLVACNSSEMNKESDIIERQDVEYVDEYKKFIKDGDEYLACGKLDKADAKRYYKFPGS